MRVMFAGTPEFAQQALVALHAAGHEIALVLTQPDRPAGTPANLGTKQAGSAGTAEQLAAVRQGGANSPQSL